MGGFNTKNKMGFWCVETRRALIAALVIFIVLGARPLSADRAIIEYLEGDVSVVRLREEFFADFGEPLEAGDLVVTGRRSSVVIRLNESARVKLRENTEIRIDSAARDASIMLESGGVFARVASSLDTIGRSIAGFQVKTHTVVAGVRGTEFFVAYGRPVDERPDLWLCVNEGVVEVLVPSTGQTVTVEEGEGVNILAGLRATKPRFFPWTRELNWNFDPDVGEVFDDTDLDAAYADLLDQDYD